MWQICRALISQLTIFPHYKDNDEWAIDITKYEDHFCKLDTNNDGFVSGLDVKDLLLSSGLPQDVLAHIWALVDLNKIGYLNLNQFSLWYIFLF
jgi:epidermal growth factor receptor substrate 15